MSVTIDNERIKYVATLVNNLSRDCLAAGLIAPMVAFSFGIKSQYDANVVAGAAILWLLAAGVLHSFVWFILERLR